MRFLALYIVKELIPQRSKRSVLDFVEDETHRMVKLQVVYRG